MSCGSPAGASTTPPTASPARCATSASTDGKVVDDVPAARAADRRARHGRDAGRRRHPRPHRRAEGQRRAPAGARGAPRATSSTARRSCARARGGTVPSTFVTGYRYALLGYTTVVEAATPPLAARHVLAELRDTPMIDAAFLLLMGNNLALFDLIRRDPARGARRGRVVAGGDGRLRRQARQPRRRRALEARQRQRHARSTTTSVGRHAAAGASTRSPARCTSSGSRIRSTSTATTSASRATGARRWTRCARWRAGARTSPTSSSTPTAAGRAGGRARARRSSPSTSARIPSSAPTSGR